MMIIIPFTAFRFDLDEIIDSKQSNRTLVG